MDYIQPKINEKFAVLQLVPTPNTHTFPLCNSRTEQIIYFIDVNYKVQTHPDAIRKLLFSHCLDRALVRPFLEVERTTQDGGTANTR